MMMKFVSKADMLAPCPAASPASPFGSASAARPHRMPFQCPTSQHKKPAASADQTAFRKMNSPSCNWTPKPVGIWLGMGVGHRDKVEYRKRGTMSAPTGKSFELRSEQLADWVRKPVCERRKDTTAIEGDYIQFTRNESWWKVPAKTVTQFETSACDCRQKGSAKCR